MTKPILYVFAISHYCEKARWALDYLDIEFEIRHVAPGHHISLAKKIGAPRSSVPILVANEQVVQGSSSIIDWADAAVLDSRKSLTPQSAGEACKAMEKRIDDVIGVHFRRYYYSEALVDQPDTVRPIFSRDLPVLQKVLFRATWGTICKLMIRVMDLGPEQGQESRAILRSELDWLDGLLADGRQFLIGDQFSRADIAAASLLAGLVSPMEHPTYSRLVIPPQINEDLVEWENRQTSQWVRRMYQQYR
jgi:glutathione S-transferase